MFENFIMALTQRELFLLAVGLSLVPLTYALFFFQLRSVSLSWVVMGLFLIASTGAVLTSPKNPPPSVQCKYVPKSTWHRYSHC